MIRNIYYGNQAISRLSYLYYVPDLDIYLLVANS